MRQLIDNQENTLTLAGESTPVGTRPMGRPTPEGMMSPGEDRVSDTPDGEASVLEAVTGGESPC